MICQTTIHEEVNSYDVRNQEEDQGVKEEVEEDLKEKEVEEEVVKVVAKEMVSVRVNLTDRAKMQGLKEDPRGVLHHNTIFHNPYQSLFFHPIYFIVNIIFIVYFSNLIYHNFLYNKFLFFFWTLFLRFVISNFVLR